MQPIYNIIKKKIKFEWTNSCAESLKNIKNIIKQEIILAHFDPQIPVVIETDASDVGVGAAMLQKSSMGHEVPCYYASRSLLDAEKKIQRYRSRSIGDYFRIDKVFSICLWYENSYTN